MLCEYSGAIADARMAIHCDKQFERAHIRLINCLILTGDYTSGLKAIEQFLEVYPNSSSILKQTEDCKILESYDKCISVDYADKKYKKVLDYLQEAMKIATASEAYKNMKVDCKSFLIKDYNTMLGVSENASLDNLKAAYKKQAALHHPDKHSGLSAEEIKFHKEKFQLIKEAFDFLEGELN